MNSITKFNPEISANNLKQKIHNVNKMTVEIVEELHKAREFYSKSGYRSDLVSDETRLKTFESYLIEIGLAKPTAYRWLERYVPEQNKLLTYDEFQEKKRIEERERMSAEERKRAMIAEFRKTGKKPNGWDRSFDYIIQKDKEAEIKQRERIEQLNKEREQQRQQNHFKNQQDREEINLLSAATECLFSQISKRNEWKDKIRISDSGKDDAFNDAILDYLETLPDDNRRIEACNNIIKICRNISIQLQKVK